MLMRPILQIAVCACCALFLSEGFAQTKPLETVPFGGADSGAAPVQGDPAAAKPKAPQTRKRKRETGATSAPEVQQLGPPKLAPQPDESPAAEGNVIRETPLPDTSRSSGGVGSITQPSELTIESAEPPAGNASGIQVPTMPGAPIANPAAPSRSKATESQKRKRNASDALSDTPAPLGPPPVSNRVRPETPAAPATSAEPAMRTPANANELIERAPSDTPAATVDSIPAAPRDKNPPPESANVVESTSASGAGAESGNNKKKGSKAKPSKAENGKSRSRDATTAVPMVPAATTAAPSAAAPIVKPMPDTPRNVIAAESSDNATAAQLRKEKEELTQLRTTTLNLMKALVDQGVLSKDRAMLLLNETERKTFEEMMAQQAATEPPPEEITSRRKRSQTVRVPLVPETVKNEIREQVKQDVLAAAKSERWAEPGALPEWLDRITWEGDLRLRYQSDRFDKENASALQYNSIEFNNLENTQQNQDLFRVRLRLGMLAKLSETVGVGIRIATGSLNNPVSTNTNLGNYANPYQLVLDRVYIKWDPNERWSVSGGRMPNPWFWPTDLVWDEDLNFEGLAGSYKPQFNEALGGFLTIGAFPLQMGAPNQRTTNPKDKWLYGVQMGTDWRLSQATRWRIGAALFEFKNIEGRRNESSLDESNNWTAPGFRQKGNTVFDIRANAPGTNPPSEFIGLASKFRVVNVGTELELAQLDPFFVRFSADYARNIGFDRAEIAARTNLDLEAKNNAYQARLTLGSDAIRKLHDWQMFGGYRYVERNAILDAFTDSDFWLGGTNNKGYFIGGFYGLDRNAFLRARWLSGNQIDGPRLKIDVLQLDMNVRF